MPPDSDTLSHSIDALLRECHTLQMVPPPDTSDSDILSHSIDGPPDSDILSHSIDGPPWYIVTLYRWSPL